MRRPLRRPSSPVFVRAAHRRPPPGAPLRVRPRRIRPPSRIRRPRGLGRLRSARRGSVAAPSAGRRHGWLRLPPVVAAAVVAGLVLRVDSRRPVAAAVSSSLPRRGVISGRRRGPPSAAPRCFPLLPPSARPRGRSSPCPHRPPLVILLAAAHHPLGCLSVSCWASFWAAGRPFELFCSILLLLSVCCCCL